MNNEILYAGIGSRETPKEVLDLIYILAKHLAGLGYVLRSGAAPGADEWFECGSDSAFGKKDIWLPWESFNGHSGPSKLPANAHFELASTHHPRWDSLGRGARALHARNMGQILGEDLNTPVNFVLCWTPDGCEHHTTRSAKTGGTGMAIALASSRGIPVINLAKNDSLARLKLFCGYLPLSVPDHFSSNALPGQLAFSF